MSLETQMPHMPINWTFNCVLIGCTYLILARVGWHYRQFFACTSQADAGEEYFQHLNDTQAGKIKRVYSL